MAKTKLKKSDYFESETFKKKAKEVSGQSFTIISGDRARKMHENYTKDQRKS